MNTSQQPDRMDEVTPATPATPMDGETSSKKPKNIPQYTVSHYKLVFDCDIVNRAITGYVDITLAANFDLDAISLHCASQIHVSAVGIPKEYSSMNLQVEHNKFNRKAYPRVPTEPPKDKMDYSLKTILGFDQSEFSFEEKGQLIIKNVLEKGRQRTYRVYFELSDPTGGIQINSKQHVMFTQYQPHHARMWFPCNDNLAEFATWEIQITTDPESIAICSGTCLRQEESSLTGLKTFYFEEKTTLCPQNIGFVVGPFKVLVNPDLPQVTHFYLSSHSLKSVKYVNSFLGKSFENCVSLTGVEYTKFFETYKQVVIDDAFSLTSSFAGLSIIDSSLLIDENIIDGAVDVFLQIDRLVCDQYFGQFMRMKTWPDYWLTVGFSGFISLQFLQAEFGKNELKYRMLKTAEELVELETHRQPLYTEKFIHPCEIVSPYLEKKSPLVLHMIQRLFKEANMKKWILKLFENAFESEVKRFLKTKTLIQDARHLFTVDLKPFADFWIYATGIPVFQCGFRYDAGRSVVEIALKQSNTWEKMFNGTVTVRVHETEGTMDYNFPIDDEGNHFEVPCRSKPKKKARRKKIEGQPDSQPKVAEKAESMVPIKWIRVDPDFDWIRVVVFKQSEGMWVHQLERDKDVVGQDEAVRALSNFGSLTALQHLENTIKDNTLYYRIRCEAAITISKMSADKQTALDSLKRVFRDYFYDKRGSFLKSNDFSNFPLYFLKQSLVTAMGNMETSDEKLSSLKFNLLIEIIKNNDNSENRYLDCFYRSHLFQALVRCPDEDKSETIGFLERQLKLDILLPSPHHVITKTCLSVLTSLGVSDPEKYWSYASLGGEVFVSVIKSILNITHDAPQKWLHRIFDGIEKISPLDRHICMVAVLECVENFNLTYSLRVCSRENHFLLAHVASILRSDLVEYDLRLRCDFIRLYQTLWGSKFPKCFLEKQPVEEMEERRSRPSLMIPQYIVPKYQFDPKKRKSMGTDFKKKKFKSEHVEFSSNLSSMKIKLPVEEEYAMTPYEIEQMEIKDRELREQIAREKDVTSTLEYIHGQQKKQVLFEKGHVPPFVNIITTTTAFAVRLYETETAKNLLLSCPIKSTILDSMKGMSYFPCPDMILSQPEEDQRIFAIKGEIAYWINGNSICIPYGPTGYTPSGLKDIVFGFPCNVLGYCDNQESWLARTKRTDGRHEEITYVKRPRRIMVEFVGCFTFSIDLYENLTADFVYDSLPRGIITEIGKAGALSYFAFEIINLKSLLKQETRNWLEYGEVSLWKEQSSILLGTGHFVQPEDPEKIKLTANCPPLGRISSGFDKLLSHPIESLQKTTIRVFKRMAKITIGENILFHAYIHDSHTGDVVYQNLPIKSTIKLWGECLHFDTNVEEDVYMEPNWEAIKVQPEDLAFWRGPNNICLAWGATGNGEVGRLQENCNIFGKIFSKDVVETLKSANLTESTEVLIELYDGFN